MRALNGAAERRAAQRFHDENQDGGTPGRNPSARTAGYGRTVRASVSEIEIAMGSEPHELEQDQGNGRKVHCGEENGTGGAPTRTARRGKRGKKQSATAVRWHDDDDDDGDPLEDDPPAAAGRRKSLDDFD